MKDKAYAVVALKEILGRALDAVEMYGAALANSSTGTSLDPGGVAGWDLEFARMTREQQVEWLLQLFNSLVND